MNSLSRLSAVAGVMTVLFSATSLGAFADGINSKNKVRIPQPAEKVAFREHLKATKLKSTVSVSDHDQTRIAALVRRNMRLALRNAAAEQKPATKVVVPVPKTTSRTRILLQGEGKTPQNCDILHTHERAECIRDAQYQKSLRFGSTLSID